MLTLAIYRGAWSLAAPLAPLLLRARAKRGKEDLARLGEVEQRQHRETDDRGDTGVGPVGLDVALEVECEREDDDGRHGAAV